MHQKKREQVVQFRYFATQHSITCQLDRLEQAAKVEDRGKQRSRACMSYQD